MNRTALADRVVNYADGVAAFSVVNALTFIIALTETEVRCSLVDLSSLVVAGQVLSSILIGGVVCLLRIMELRVRARITPLEPDVESFLKGFFLARLGVIAASTLLAVAAARMALSDTSCSALVA